MKRLSSLLMAVLMVVTMVSTSLVAVAAAEISTISLSAPAEVEFTGDAVNDSFQVEANLNLADGLTAIAGYEVKITWDPACLTVLEVVTSGDGITDKNFGEGSLTLAVVNATNVLSGRLFYVSFAPVAEGDATVSVEVLSMATATGLIEAEGSAVTVTAAKPVVIYEIPEEIVNAAYELENGEYLSDGYKYTLTGEIISIQTAYSEQYKNVSVYIAIEGLEAKPILCYRLKGEGADVIKIGDTITVTGKIKNYNDTIEFDSGCTLDSYVPGEPEVIIYETPEEIVNAAYELDKGATLSAGHLYTLTGVIVSIDTAYSEQYGNITVTIQVGDMTDKLMKCYRMKGEGAADLKVGDTITVTGAIKNYNGTVEFDAGCTLDEVVPAPVPENSKVDVTVEGILTDGKTGFTGNWGEVGTGDVLLIANPNCTTVGMDVTLNYALGEAKKINGVTVDLYHCANVMIGYPEGQATVLVSVDGENWTEVGKYDLAAADLALDAYGTVSNAFAFDEVDAAYVKVLLYAGSNEAVLGKEPAGGKIFWEFISVAEFAVSEVKVEEPVENTKVDVTVEGILTDGKTGFDGDWGTVGTGDVVLVANGNCTAAGMDVTLTYALGEAKKINGVTVDLYHCANVMIGYPEGQATVLVSVDGENWTEVGKYDLTAAEVALGAYGTVSNAFAFDEVEAAYVKVLLYAGSNEAVLGTEPAGGKIFWEFIAVAEVAVSEVPAVVIYETPEEIVNAAYELENGEYLSDGYKYTLTGEIISIQTAYSEQYKNVSVYIAIEGLEAKPILCYRLKGEGADVIKIGDTITVTGKIKNYNGTIEFDSGCTLDSYVPGEPEVIIYETPEEIVNAAYELDKGATLSAGHLYTLTGVITSIDTAYSEQYGNITVTIQVGDMTDKLMKCYRMKGEGAADLKVGDTITVTGVIKNYNGTVEFDAGCTLDEVVPAPVPENSKVDVTVEGILTDGKTGFTGNWGEVGTGDVLLIANPNCTTVGMDVTLNYALGEAKKINGVTIDLYHCANVMIGYPEGQATVLVSVDGENWTEVGKYDLAAADLALDKFGTVSNAFSFDEVEAAYVKVLLYAGSNEAVLGKEPAGGKIFWEFISVAEFAVSEVKVEEPVENTKVDVTVEGILTDGKTGFTGNWGEVGTGDVLLIANPNCTTVGMDVTLNYALGEAKKINGVTIDLYHCANVMIGYPEGQATVLVSVDGENWTEVGKYDLAAADLALDKFGTVSNAFAFDEVEAAYVKVLLYAGSNEAVLGTEPAGGKIFWEFISVAEFAVSEVEEKPTFEFGDVDGNGKVNALDYAKLKRYCLKTFQLDDEQLVRADINGDGKVNAVDYALLKRYCLKTWAPKN